MNKDLKSKLTELKIEDIIWIIYIGIIILSWYANYLERKFFIFQDQKAKKNYRNIMIGIFTVLLIVYFYFFYSSYQSLTNLKENDSNNKKKLVLLSFISSLLILISGCIFLYIAFKDEDLTVELAFN